MFRLCFLKAVKTLRVYFGSLPSVLIKHGRSAFGAVTGWGRVGRVSLLGKHNVADLLSGEAQGKPEPELRAG